MVGAVTGNPRFLDRIQGQAFTGVALATLLTALAVGILAAVTKGHFSGVGKHSGVALAGIVVGSSFVGTAAITAIGLRSLSLKRQKPKNCTEAQIEMLRSLGFVFVNDVLFEQGSQTPAAVDVTYSKDGKSVSVVKNL